MVPFGEISKFNKDSESNTVTIAKTPAKDPEINATNLYIII